MIQQRDTRVAVWPDHEASMSAGRKEDIIIPTQNYWLLLTSPWWCQCRGRWWSRGGWEWPPTLRLSRWETTLPRSSGVISHIKFFLTRTPTFFERWGLLGRAMVMYLSTAILLWLQTAATMDRWVMKFVMRQKYSPNTQSLKQAWQSSPLQNTFNLLIFHENKVEGAVKCCVYQVSQAKIEDEDVRDTSHLLVFWTKKSIYILLMEGHKNEKEFSAFNNLNVHKCKEMRPFFLHIHLLSYSKDWMAFSEPFLTLSQNIGMKI